MYYGGQHSHEGGHRSADMKNMEGCLVGEVLAGAPTAASILQELPSTDVSLGQPESFRLDSGNFFLRRLSKMKYWEFSGTIQITRDNAQIRWRCPLATDGGLMVSKEIVTIEAREVPFGLRSWIHMANIVRSFGSFKSMLNNGIQ